MLRGFLGFVALVFAAFGLFYLIAPGPLAVVSASRHARTG